MLPCDRVTFSMTVSALMRLMMATVRSCSAGRRVFWLLSAALMLVAAVRGRSASPNDAAPSDAPQHEGFRYSPGTCEQGPEFCALATPRAWAPAEIALVRAALDEIAASDLGRWILQRARRNGFVTLRRFAHSAELDAEDRYGV